MAMGEFSISRTDYLDPVEELDDDLDFCLVSLKAAGQRGSVVAIGPVQGGQHFSMRWPHGEKFAQCADRLVTLLLAETSRDVFHERTGSRYELRVRLTPLGREKAREVEADTANERGGL
jgi:hypothetical protein